MPGPSDSSMTVEALLVSVRRRALGPIGVALMAASACTGASPSAPSPVALEPSSPSAVTSATIGLESALSLCADEINRYRASAGLARLQRSSDLDAFAARAAEHDHVAGTPHEYFRKTNGGGVARAENQLLLWKGYAASEVIRRGLALMWQEGQAGRHYQIMAGAYSQVGCGVYMVGAEVSVSQAFR